MRTTGTNEEVAHAWAHQTQEEMRNGNGSIYFRGKTIFSYGNHFPIATIYDDQGILFTSRDYSVTTNRHKSIVLHSIPHYQIFIVPNVMNPHDPENVEQLIHVAEEYRERAKRSKKYGSSYCTNYSGSVERLSSFVQCFQIPMTDRIREILSVPNHPDEEKIRIRCQEWEDNRQEREEKKRKAEQERNRENIEKWKRNEIPYLRCFTHEDYLRINSEKGIVESSRSCNVPIHDARLLWKLIERGSDIKGIKAGIYTVIGMEDGFLKIGCHRFSEKTVREIGEQLDAMERN